MSRLHGLRILALLLLAWGGLASAETAEVTIKDVTDLTSKRDALIDAARKQQAPPGSTPLSTVLAIVAAVDSGDWEEATTYIDLRYLEGRAAGESGAELIRKLVILWRQQRILDVSSVSNEPDGSLDDDLPDNRELVGVLQSKKGEVPAAEGQV